MTATTAQAIIRVTSSTILNEHNEAVAQIKCSITFRTDINIHLHPRRIVGSGREVLHCHLRSI
jgi:hypothetical protein